jgi:hypothetical protein
MHARMTAGPGDFTLRFPQRNGGVECCAVRAVHNPGIMSIPGLCTRVGPVGDAITVLSGVPTFAVDGFQYHIMLDTDRVGRERYGLIDCGTGGSQTRKTPRQENPPAAATDELRAVQRRYSR